MLVQLKKDNTDISWREIAEIINKRCNSKFTSLELVDRFEKIVNNKKLSAE